MIVFIKSFLVIRKLSTKSFLLSRKLEKYRLLTYNQYITIMTSLKFSLQWLKKNPLFVASLALIAFIPLYPKIPLFDILPGYIVRARLEDVLLIITGIIWLFQAIKNKKEWRNGYIGLVGFYALSGLVSILLGIFLLQTIPAQLLHISKSGLHYFRYLEYFSIFFFTFSAIKNAKQTKIALITLAVTTALVIGYGMGQKFAHLPLYSTMNREYSKGQAFYLQPGEKVQSTFGGHYDLAAFLVIVLPLIFSLSLTFMSRRRKDLLMLIALILIELSGVWLLIETGSKTALIAYLVGIVATLFLHLKRIENKRTKRLAFTASLIAFVAFMAIFMFTFGRKTIVKLTTLVSSSFQSQENALPEDLVGSGIEIKTYTTVSPDGKISVTQKFEKSQWSPNALKYGISMGIRLDTLWPQAIRGFVANPLFGSGYGTLSKEGNQQFTEADSTDNNFLRTLGETGLVGFVSFYGLIIICMYQVGKVLKDKTGVFAALGIGYLAGAAGLLVNALYIDVFASSKVALTFWALSGLTLSSLTTKSGVPIFIRLVSHLRNHRNFYLILILSMFLFHQNPLAENSALNRFDVSRQAQENFVSARCFVETGKFALCRSSGLEANTNFSLYSLLLVPFVWLLHTPISYYYLNLFIVIGVLLVSYRYLKIRSLLGLLFIVVFAYEGVFTGGPLEDGQLLRILLVPIAVIILEKTLLKSQRKNIIRLAITGGLVLAILLRLNSGGDFLKHFRNENIVLKKQSVLQANGNIPLTSMTGADENFLITTLSPYYVDLYTNNSYQTLPFSSSQDYVDRANQVWGEHDFSSLGDLYQKLIKENNLLFLADYGVAERNDYLQEFATLRKNFDVRYKTIDCDELCSLYTVSQLSEKISPLPMPVGKKSLIPADLPAEYSFAIISNRFEPAKEGETPYTYLNFLSKLSPLSQEKFDFSVITGDVTPDNDKTKIPTLQVLYADAASYPVLYSPGNYDLLPNKPLPQSSERFFSDRDYFILLNIGPDSRINPDQRLFVYNALLELEQLPNIKNLFIIAHDLNWQDKSDPKNFIHALESKLADFLNLNSYVFTADHSDGILPTEMSNGNLHYYANGMINAESDSYLKINVQENEVKTDFIPSTNPTFGSQPSSN